MSPLVPRSHLLLFSCLLSYFACARRSFGLHLRFLLFLTLFLTLLPFPSNTLFTWWWVTLLHNSLAVRSLKWKEVFGSRSITWDAWARPLGFNIMIFRLHSASDDDVVLWAVSYYYAVVRISAEHDTKHVCVFLLSYRVSLFCCCERWVWSDGGLLVVCKGEVRSGDPASETEIWSSHQRPLRPHVSAPHRPSK